MKTWLVIVVACLPAMVLTAWSHGPVAQVWLLGANALVVGLYAHDKTAAQRGGLRTPELVLHMLAFAGAAAGAAWARHAFRHKTLKSHFELPLVLGTGLLWWVALH